GRACIGHVAGSGSLALLRHPDAKLAIPSDPSSDIIDHDLSDCDPGDIFDGVCDALLSFELYLHFAGFSGKKNFPEIKNSCRKLQECRMTKKSSSSLSPPLLGISCVSSNLTRITK
ncbi:MAG: hypothetical protein GY847_19225, partial [Proteobacteria bacterium]|nr:hypothetical protein [Pseudomonadota bacterium]